MVRIHADVVDNNIDVGDENPSKQGNNDDRGQSVKELFHDFVLSFP